MLRLAILADIHGNLPALEAVVTDLAQQAVDQVIVAGDLIHWAPDSAAVVQSVLDAGWSVIRGNHEFYLLDYQTPRAPAAWSDPSQFGSLAWLSRQLAGPLHHRIAAWPDSLRLCLPGTPPLLVYHGSPRHNRDGLYPNDSDERLIESLAGVEATTVIVAHTHLAMERRPGRWHLLNPGSVGVPFDGRHAASYLLLDGDASGWRATFRRIPFALDRLLARIEQAGYAAHWGLLGPLLIDEFRQARLRIYPFLSWRARHYPDQPLTAQLMARYAEVDPLDYTPAVYRALYSTPPPL
jgi:predicted phosphodiesterase